MGEEKYEYNEKEEEIKKEEDSNKEEGGENIEENKEEEGGEKIKENKEEEGGEKIKENKEEEGTESNENEEKQIEKEDEIELLLKRLETAEDFPSLKSVLMDSFSAMKKMNDTMTAMEEKLD